MEKALQFHVIYYGKEPKSVSISFFPTDLMLFSPAKGGSSVLDTPSLDQAEHSASQNEEETVDVQAKRVAPVVETRVIKSQPASTRIFDRIRKLLGANKIANAGLKGLSFSKKFFRKRTPIEQIGGIAQDQNPKEKKVLYERKDDNPVQKALRSLKDRNLSYLPNEVYGIKVSWIVNFLTNHPACKRLFEFDWSRHFEMDKTFYLPCAYQLKTVVMELTNEWKCSVAELLMVLEPGAVRAKPDRFISHAWQCPLQETLELLKSPTFNPDEFVYFDCLCHNQHATISTEAYLEMFRAAIQHTGRVSAFLYPYATPKAYERIWCIYELFTCSERDEFGKAKFNLDVVISPKNVEDFETKLLQNPLELIQAFQVIDPENAEQNVDLDAEKENTKIMIRNFIKNSAGGYKKIVNLVMRRLGEQLTDMAVSTALRSKLEASMDAETLFHVFEQVTRLVLAQNQYARAIELFHDMLAFADNFKREDDAFQARIKTQESLATSYLRSGKNDDALYWVDETMKQKNRDSKVPKIHLAPDYALKALIHADNEDYEKAMKASRENTKIRTEFYQESQSKFMHPMMAADRANAITLQCQQGSVSESVLEEYDVLVLYFASYLIPLRYPENANADPLRKEEASRMLKSISSADEQSLSNSHMSLANLLGNYAVVLKQLGYLDVASRCLEEVIAMKERIQKFSGSSSPEIVTSKINLANVKFAQGNFEGAYEDYCQIRADLTFLDPSFAANNTPEIIPVSLAAIINWNAALCCGKLNNVEQSGIFMKRAQELNPVFALKDRPKEPKDAFDKIEVPASQGTLFWMSGRDHLGIFLNTALLYGEDYLPNGLDREDVETIYSVIEYSVRRTFGSGFVPIFNKAEAQNVLLPAIKAGLESFDLGLVSLLNFNANAVPHVTRNKECLSLLDIFYIICSVPERFCMLDTFPENSIFKSVKSGHGFSLAYAVSALGGASLAVYMMEAKATSYAGKAIYGAARYNRNLGNLGRLLGFQKRPMVRGLNFASFAVDLTVGALLHNLVLNEREGEDARHRRAKREARIAYTATSIVAGFALAIIGGPAALGIGILKGSVAMAVGPSVLATTVSVVTKEYYNPGERPPRSSEDWQPMNQWRYQQKDMNDKGVFTAWLVTDFKDMKKTIHDALKRSQNE